jgi:hypothetical protein
MITSQGIRLFLVDPAKSSSSSDILFLFRSRASIRRCRCRDWAGVNFCSRDGVWLPVMAVLFCVASRSTGLPFPANLAGNLWIARPAGQWPVAKVAKAWAVERLAPPNPIFWGLSSVNPWPTSESRLEKGTASRPLQLCVAMKVLPLWSICLESDAIWSLPYANASHSSIGAPINQYTSH